MSNYQDEIIQLTFNTLYPGKEVIPPAPDNSHDKDYELIEFPQKKEHLHGLCAGMSMDHMNRVRNSKKPFWETIKELGTKFSKGCTKKGYINQFHFHHITLSDDYRNRLKKLLTDGLIKLLKEEPQYNEAFVDKFVDDNLCLYLFADRLNFVAAKNYALKYFGDLDDKKTIPNGDYILIEGDDRPSSHAISIYKRDEGSVIFEPNLGTLYIKDDQKLTSFIKETAELYYTKDKTTFKLFQAGEPSPC